MVGDQICYSLIWMMKWPRVFFVRSFAEYLINKATRMFSKLGRKSYFGNVCMSIFVYVDVHICVCAFIHVCTYTFVFINVCMGIFTLYFLVSLAYVYV